MRIEDENAGMGTQVDKKIILVVEDDSIIGLDIENTLKRMGYDVLEGATSGEEALRAVEQTQPDLIIMDIFLDGDIDGIEATEKIQEKYDIPVIYLTAHTQEATFKRARQTSPYGYLVKPAGRNDIYSAVETALQRHELEKRLRQSEEKFRELVENIDEVIYSVDDTGIITYISPAVESLFGHPAQYVIGRAFTEFMYEEDLPHAQEEFNSGKRGNINPVEYRLVARSGELRWIQAFNNPVYEGDRIKGFQGILTDITERKNTEEKLRSIENRYQSLFDRTLHAVYICDFQGNFIDANDTALALLGYKRDEIKNLNYASLLDDEQLSKAFQSMNEHLEKGFRATRNEYRLKRKDGSSIWIETDAGIIYHDGKPFALQGIAHDITERKLAEERIRSSEERFRSLVETTSDWIWEVDTEGRYTYSSPKVNDLLGYDPQEIVGRKLFDFKPTGEAASIDGIIRSSLQSARPYTNLRTINTHKDGHEVILESSGIPIFDTDGNLISFRGIDRDITERVKAEEALAEVEKRKAEYHGNLEFLTRSALEFLDFSPEKDIYYFIGEKLRQITGRSIILINYFEKESDSLCNRAVIGLGTYMEKVLQAFGKSPFLMKAKVTDESSRKEMLSGRLIKIAGGIHELLFGSISKGLARRIENIIGFQELFGIGFSWNNELFGNAVIILLQDAPPLNTELIEAFIYQSSVTLQRFRAEGQIKKSLREKDMLLKEIHHRVKNNLQIITSLLSLQENRIENEDMLQLYRVSRERIRAMSLLYERLYQSEDLDQIDFAEYLNTLVKELVQTYQTDKGIALEISAEGIHLTINQAIPCGLIINELISNSLKYAFPRETGGSKTISINTYQKKDMVEMNVSDNGIGLPRGISVENATTLGLRLVSILIQTQLKGTVQLNRKGGTEFIIRFKRQHAF